MEDRSILRRTLLTASVTAGLVAAAGCSTRQEPEATHWAAGIRWSDPPGEVFREMGFSASPGSLSDPATEYLRVNGGDLIRNQRRDDSVPADRGDHVEFVIDFGSTRQGKETVFEYTIPHDEDVIGVLAGFAECLHYRDPDEWIVRPLNVDLDTDLLGRPSETLLVRVSWEHGDGHPAWYVWGHTESIREALRDRAATADAEIDVEFVEPGEAATVSPATIRRVGMQVTDGANPVAGVGYRPVDDESE